MKTKIPGQQLPLQEMKGTIERITFQNEENGYMIARFKTQENSEEVTIVGNLTGVNVGEFLRLHGLWTNHPQYGRQFDIHTFSIELPATIEGIRKYLGSGLIKGVGPATAEKIVSHFGMDTLDTIDHFPDKLNEVHGIGEKKVQIIIEAWETQKQIKEIMIFLQGLGVSATLAVKIYKYYGNAAIEIIRNDPYRLSKDIYGIGFKTADKIAQQIGLPADSPSRIQAGLSYTLGKLADDGHCFALQLHLISEAARLLELPKELLHPQLQALFEWQELIPEDDAVYLPPFYIAEVGVAKRIQLIKSAQRDRLSQFKKVDWISEFHKLDLNHNIHLTDQQKSAIQMALTNKISVLTGGPGTGKSTITGSLISILKAHHGTVILAAPTGRAAKRLSETTGLEAKTIHRLLEFSPVSGNQFQRDKENPLNADLIIIDETSMVELLLMYHLLNAIDVGSHVLFVGDVDQLPSVGPGNVLKDFINSGECPVTRLDTIFRQSENSHIIVNAHRINRGELPVFSKESTDFFLFAEPDPQKAADWVIEVVTQRIQDRFGFDPCKDIQILSPMHRGVVGVSELNERLQAVLNPESPQKTEIRQSHRILRNGDKIMQIRNNYEKQVFNGDMGKIFMIDLEDQIVQVDFEERIIHYEFSELDELMHAFAISIHKSQGSEFPVVVIPLLPQHYLMLQRNLLYTGITRARKLVVLIGSKQAIASAVHNNRITRRNTRLVERLQNKSLHQIDHSGQYTVI